MELKKEIHTEKMPPVEVTALAEPCPDGQKITKAILTFRGEVPDVEQITVRNRTITGRRVEGKTVTLELDLEDELAWVLPPPVEPPAPNPGEGAPQKPRELPLRVRRPVEVFVSEADAAGGVDIVLPQQRQGFVHRGRFVQQQTDRGGDGQIRLAGVRIWHSAFVDLQIRHA